MTTKAFIGETVQFPRLAAGIEERLRWQGFEVQGAAGNDNYLI